MYTQNQNVYFTRNDSHAIQWPINPSATYLTCVYLLYQNWIWILYSNNSTLYTSKLGKNHLLSPKSSLLIGYGDTVNGKSRILDFTRVSENTWFLFYCTRMWINYQQTFSNRDDCDLSDVYNFHLQIQTDHYGIMIIYYSIIKQYN